MRRKWVSLTVYIPPEMKELVDELVDKYYLGYSEFLRSLIRQKLFDVGLRHEGRDVNEQ
ncbi:MAG: ribbon-helix-helix domain-containing protein [Desulfurococcales archaeon]|nr:ribbon-helix-helix domain-containing protein [Desulfurococcales archaeon]